MSMTKSISELRPVGVMLNAWEQTTGCRCYQWLATIQCNVETKLIGESKNNSHRTRLFLANLLHEWMRSGQKEKRSVECEWILLIVCVEMGLGRRGNHLTPKNVACLAVGGPILSARLLDKTKTWFRQGKPSISREREQGRLMKRRYWTYLHVRIMDRFTNWTIPKGLRDRQELRRFELLFH